MFKIGTALVTGVLAAFLTVLTAVSAGARFSTAAGRSLAVFLVVTALIFLVAFFFGKAVPCPFCASAVGGNSNEERGKSDADGE